MSHPGKGSIGNPQERNRLLALDTYEEIDERERTVQQSARECRECVRDLKAKVSC